MTEPRGVIDIGDYPELVRLVDELRGSDAPYVLRQGDEDVALLTPVSPVRRFPWRKPTEDDYAAFRSAAGSWRDHFDAEEFIRENYERRRLPARPPVDP